MFVANLPSIMQQQINVEDDIDDVVNNKYSSKNVEK